MALRIASGTYTGTAAIQDVTVSPSFAIRLLLIKTTSNNVLSDGADAVLDVLPAGNSIQMFQNAVFQTGVVTSIGTGTFRVPIGPQNILSVEYSYVAIGGTNSEFLTSTYTGNGSTQSITAPGFQPTGVFLTKTGGNGNPAVGNFGLGGGDSTMFWTSGQANLTARITSLTATGFNLGSNTEANQNAQTYYYAAYPTIAGAAVSGSYTGNGSSQSITSLTFQPDVVIIKGNNTSQAIFKSSNGTTGTNSLPFGTSTAQITTGITALNSNGFSVSSDATVNTNAVTYQYMAFKDQSGTTSTGLLMLMGAGT